MIRGYRAEVDQEAVGLGVTALIGIVEDSGADTDDVLAALRAMPEIESCYFMAGVESFLLKVRVGTIAELEQLHRAARTGRPGWPRPGPAIALSTKWENRPQPRTRHEPPPHAAPAARGQPAVRSATWTIWTAATTATGWVTEAIAAVEADANRSADTHLLPFPLPREWGVDLYLKDESSHPTGSLKHRLARSLFLYGLCNGWIGPRTTVVEASSGSTAVSEAYFARMLGLPFIAVMPATTSPEKIALIEFQGGKCHLVDDPADVVAEARRLAERLRRPLHGPVHLRRAGHRLAGQQQHRRVDLRAAGAGTAPRAGLDRGRAPAPAAPAPPSAGTPATGGCPPSSAWSTRRTRRSTRPGRPATGRYAPARAPGSRASAGRAWRRRSCPRWWTGWCRCPTPPRWPRCAPARRCSAAGSAAPPAPTCGARSG